MKSKAAIKAPSAWESRAMIVLLAFVAFWPTLRVGFLWDDHVMIEANPTLREWSVPTIAHDFTTDVFDGHGDSYYRPAQTLLNRIDFTIWGLRPFGYHLTNWIGHALNAVLVYELVLVLGLGALTGLLAASLFAVNPMPVEQLIIIAGRAEIFGLTFMLLSFLFMLRNRPREWAMGYLAFVAALLFKESSIITPAVLACLMAYDGAKRADYWRLVPFILLTIPYLILRHMAVGPLLPQFDLGYVAKFFTEAFPRVLWMYCRLILIPWNLHSHRLMPHLTHAWPFILAFWVMLAVVLIRKGVKLGWLSLAWFILMLLPRTPAMIYGNFMLDHWAYPASIGLILPVAAIYNWLWHRGSRVAYRCAAFTFFPLLIGWALLVHLNVALRGTDESMFRWALNFTTSNPIRYNLGVLLVHTGRSREALPYLFDYRSAYPDDPAGQFAIAEAYWRLGHEHASLGISKQLIQQHPEYIDRVRALHLAHH